MTKTPQSKEDLEQHFEEQLRFLSRSAEAYDAGFTDEAKRLAVTIRILVHDTRSSTSLLTQLNQKKRLFYDTSVPDEAGNLVPYGALTQIAAGLESATYLPFLDGPLPRGVQPRHVEFEPWWMAPIIRTVNEDIFSRRDLVLSMADQDGGAHIDPKLDEAYARLTREDGIGWQHEGSKGKHVIQPADRAAVRQIAHEVLKTFDPTINKIPKQPDGALFNIGSMTAVIGGAERRAVPVEVVVRQAPPTVVTRNPVMPPVLPVRVGQKTGRNDPCPCGSGKKFKVCHGR
jgi:SEC-C motif